MFSIYPVWKDISPFFAVASFGAVRNSTLSYLAKMAYGGKPGFKVKQNNGYMMLVIFIIWLEHCFSDVHDTSEKDIDFCHSVQGILIKTQLGSLVAWSVWLDK